MFIRAAAVDGRNPTKRNLLLGKPDTTSAASGAEGPGIGIIDIPAAIVSLTNRYPGSEIRGVPASQTNAIALPF